MKIKTNKKAELEDTILTISLIIGVLIIGVWFIFFVGSQTTQNQNLQFSALNKFSTYYELILNVDQANISGIEIETLKNTNLSIKNKHICIETASIIRLCNDIISNSTGIENNYILNEINYFTFEKKEDGTINVYKK